MMTTLPGSPTRSIRNALRAMTTAALITAGLCFVAPVGVGASSNGSSNQQQKEWSCAMAQATATLTLSDTSPIPTIKVHVGQTFSVLIPPWHWGHPTDVTIENSAVLHEVCTAMNSSGWRRVLLVARSSGRSHVSATVTPASNLMMPAWSGVVEVIGVVGSAALVTPDDATGS